MIREWIALRFPTEVARTGRADHPTRRSILGDNRPIRTPDQRLRVFISSTLSELGPERDAARTAVRTLRLSPVMFELGARPHPPRDLYRSYLSQSDVFVGIYWQSYGWIAPDEELSGLEDEYQLSGPLPRLIYLKEPAPDRHPRLNKLLDRVIGDGTTSFRTFHSPAELSELLLDDLALLVTERFHGPEPTDDLPGGVLSFVFTDLVSSTQIHEHLGDDYPGFLESYQSTIREIVTGHRGYVVNSGESQISAVFPQPIDAATAAVEIHTQLAAGSWPEPLRPKSRIGIHTGTATRAANGYVGLDFDRAARIGVSSHPGQTLISAVTAGLIADDARRFEWTLSDLGSFAVHETFQPEQLFSLDYPGQELPTLAPGDRWLVSNTLPSTPQALIGRREDMDGVSEMLARPGVRLVSVTGPGGTGKTRLALEIARRAQLDFPYGVSFIDLSAVRTREELFPALGRAFGIRESGERTIPEALAALVGSKQMLVILDNMEQLLPAGGEIADLLERLPNIKILVTSRAPLRVTWEHEYPLAPLPVPEAAAGTEAISENHAVALFVERAQAVRPSFTLDAENAEVVAEICRRLDGLPLAIELAAARLRLFTPQMLLERLDDRLSVLNRGPADAPERHRTLRAAMEWSHDLLGDHEQAVFRRLGVFCGGWSLEAAIAVGRDDRFDELHLMDHLDDLVSKSLVVFALGDNGEPRYRMLAILRELALEKLREAGEESVVRALHREAFLALGARADQGMPSPEYPEHLNELERERLNIHEALRWSSDSGTGLEEALTICGLLPLFWDTRGSVIEGLQWTDLILRLTEQEPDSPGRARALETIGWLAMLAGDPVRSERAFHDSEQIWRSEGDELRLAWSLAMNGMTTYNRGKMTYARQLFEEAIELAERHGEHWLSRGWCSYGLAHIALNEGDFEATDRYLNQTLDLSRGMGMTWGIGHAQLSLGVLAFMKGDVEQAIDRMIESLEVRRELRDSRGTADCLGMMALFASTRQDFRRTAQLLGAVERLREAVGARTVPWQVPFLDQAEAAARGVLGDSYDLTFQEGRSLNDEQAIAVALEVAVATTAASATSG